MTGFSFPYILKAVLSFNNNEFESYNNEFNMIIEIQCIRI